MYTTTLKANDKEYKAKGKTLLECLEKIKGKYDLGWTSFKTKGVLTVTKGTHSYERPFPVIPLKRMFSRPLNMQTVARDCERALI